MEGGGGTAPILGGNATQGDCCLTFREIGVCGDTVERRPLASCTSATQVRDRPPPAVHAAWGHLLTQAYGKVTVQCQAGLDLILPAAFFSNMVNRMPGGSRFATLTEAANNERMR